MEIRRAVKGKIGVSFPNMNKTPGGSIRIHGRSSDIQRFSDMEYLAGLRDYINPPKILEVPKGCRHQVIRRIQPKSNPARLYARSVRKGWITLEEAEKKVKEATVRQSRAPFFILTSRSSMHKFKLFLDSGPLLKEPVSGKFSSYGLSSTATVPVF